MRLKSKKIISNTNHIYGDVRAWQRREIEWVAAPTSGDNLVVLLVVRPVVGSFAALRFTPYESRVVATARAAASPRVRQECYTRRAVRILFVDDDPAATRLYRVMLTNAGHEVSTVESGIEAVELAVGERFDLVITDFNMPGIKGDVTLSLLRARLPNLPVVILTSEPSPTVEKRARDAGAAGFLRKPCTPDVLARTIERARKKVVSGGS